MSFDFSTLVRDRTQADVSARNNKGTYNAEDLNRVTAALDDLWQRFLSAGYTLPRYKKIEIEHNVSPAPEPEPESRLPDGYVELAWIESTGTQYINTGVNPNINTSLFIDARIVTTSGFVYPVVFGSRQGDTNRFWMYRETNGKMAAAINVSFSYLEQTGLERMNYSIDGTTAKAGNASVTLSASSYQASYPIYLCAVNNAGTAQYPSAIEIYSCQIYDNGTLVRDYVPCKNESGAFGLYDMVNAQFYGNAGSGNFTGGEAVAVPAMSAATTATVAEEITEYDPYLWYDIDVPTARQMVQYLANVDDVRLAFTMLSTTPATPASMELLTWAKANNIEQILIDADTLLTALAAVYLRSGMVWACANGPGFYFMN